jgi:hypothetical protein
MLRILAILLTASLQAQTYTTIDSNGTKVLHIDESPNFMAMVYHDDDARQPLEPLVFDTIAELDIKPSTTIYLEPEKFVIKHSEPFIEVKEFTDWNKVVEWLFNIPILIFSSLFWVWKKLILHQ